MSSRRVVTAVTVVSLLVVVSAAQAATRPLRTAVFDPFTSLQAPGWQARAAATGAGFVRLGVNWAAVAPKGGSPPAQFDAADPEDPAYDWTALDAEVEAAVAGALEPIVDVMDAPDWAQDGPSKQYYGPVRPHAAELGQFAHAVATRYSGSFQGLPRVRYWMFWNEPNLVFYLRPQFQNGQAASPGIYRPLLNAFANAVHGVHPDNVVIAGATAPFTSHTGATSEWGLSPLTFMRDLLCLSKTLKPTCHQRATFDVWAHHPYTSGGPTHHANLPNDVSLGDLPKMRAVLLAAERAHHIVSHGSVGFWVTEFSWDTSPPDPKAVPVALQARWVAEALETMWRSGVSLVTWFTLQDQPMSQGPYQSGLYFADGRPKPALTAFRFPFVARMHGARLHVWARTPRGAAGTILVEKRGSGWRRLTTLRTDRYGIVDTDVAGSAGVYRAVMGKDTSLAFSTHEPPDHFYPPFGSS